MDDSEKRLGLLNHLAPGLGHILKPPDHLFKSSDTSSELEVTMRGTGTGTVKRVPDLKSYSADQVVQLTAVAGPDSRFVRWMNDATGSDTTCFVKMDRARWVFADFEELGSAKLRKIPDAGAPGAAVEQLKVQESANPVAHLATEKRIGYQGRFIDHGDGTTTDTLSGLMWMRPSVGQEWKTGKCIGPPKYLSLTTANQFESDFAGYLNWRLPTIEELAELIVPALDKQAFPDQPRGLYWSSSLNTADSRDEFKQRRMIIDLHTGRVGYSKLNPDPEYARLVRDVQFQSFGIITSTTGTGGGTISSSLESGQRIRVNDYIKGSLVTLTAQTAPNSRFIGWHGSLRGGNPVCVLTVDEDKTILAEFALLETFSLTATSIGNGAGEVLRDVDAINYFDGTQVKLTARAKKGSEFKCWHGDAVGQSSTCTVTMDSAKTLSAEFIPLRKHALDVRATGTGSGRIEKSIEARTYFTGSEVTLTAIADEGSIFNGWHGAVTSLADSITIKVDAATSISADFQQLTIAETDVIAQLAFVERSEIKRGLFATVFGLTLRNKGARQLRLKVPLTSYVGKSGQTNEQHGWVTGQLNGSKGVTLSAHAFCEMGLVHFVTPTKGDRLYINVEHVPPSGRICFTFQCTGVYGSLATFVVINASHEDLVEVPPSKVSNPALTSALKRIASLEGALAEVLNRLDAIQQRLPTKVGSSTPIQSEPMQTLTEIWAWVAEHDRIAFAELRAKLLPLDLLPDAAIDEMNERALDLIGELALEHDEDVINVSQVILSEAIKNMNSK